MEVAQDQEAEVTHPDELVVPQLTHQLTDQDHDLAQDLAHKHA